MKQRIALGLTVIMLFMLYACGSNDSHPTSASSAVPSVPASTPTSTTDSEATPATTNEPAQFEELRAQLIELRDFYKNQVDDLKNVSAFDEAKRAFELMDTAETALLVGHPLEVELIYSSGKVVQKTIFSAPDANPPYLYHFSSEEDTLEKVRLLLELDEDTEIFINGNNYNCTKEGNIEILLSEWNETDFEIEWIPPRYYPFVVTFKVTTTEGDSYEESDFHYLIGEYEVIRQHMEQHDIEIIDALVSEINTLRETILENKACFEKASAVYSPVYAQLEKAENALKNGMYLRMSVPFPTTISSLELMAVEESSPMYVFPNPWGDGIPSEMLLFEVPPSATVTVNGITIPTNGHGIAKYPLDTGYIPQTIDISIMLNGKVFTVKLEGEPYDVFSQFYCEFYP